MIRRLFLLLSVSLLLCLSVPTYAVADRSLYLTVDKTVFALGENVTITIQIGKESCKEHAHDLDVYIYDSAGILVHEVDWGRTPFEQAFGLGLFQPWDFPVKTTYRPAKVDAYSIKLWVIHAYGGGHWRAYLEDTATFKVVPYMATAQTTSAPTTTQPLTMTRPAIVTITTTTSATVTRTEIGVIEIDWARILMVMSVALLVFAAFEIGRRRGRKSHVVTQPMRTRARPEPFTELFVSGKRIFLGILQ